jgi:hypothetical protein
MTKIFAQKLILGLTALHCAVVGAGFGERILYFGGGHAGHGCASTEHHEEVGNDQHVCADATEHSHDHHVGWLHFLPVALPVGSNHGNHHENGCEHVHLSGVDAATRSSRDVAIAAPAPAPWPPRRETLAPPPALFSRACDLVRASEQPPDPPLSTVSWRI